MQTKKHSAYEACANTAIGFGVSWALTFYVLPYYLGVSATKRTATMIVIIYTIASIVRSYLIRRAFNYVNGPAESGSNKNQEEKDERRKNELC